MVSVGRIQTIVGAIGLLMLAGSVVKVQDRSADCTEPYQQRALDIYRTSITYRTAASHGQVPDLANYLVDQFRAGGFTDEDIHILVKYGTDLRRPHYL